MQIYSVLITGLTKDCNCFYTFCIYILSISFITIIFLQLAKLNEITTMRTNSSSYLKSPTECLNCDVIIAILPQEVVIKILKKDFSTLIKAIKTLP